MQPGAQQLSHRGRAEYVNDETLLRVPVLALNQIAEELEMDPESGGDSRQH